MGRWMIACPIAWALLAELASCKGSFFYTEKQHPEPA